MRWGHPQKDIEQAGGNVVEHLGAVLKPKVYNVAPHTCDSACSCWHGGGGTEETALALFQTSRERALKEKSRE